MPHRLADASRAAHTVTHCCVSIYERYPRPLSLQVSRAYERIGLLVTTNLPFEARTGALGTERLTGARLDRLTHRIHILEANGESYRLSESTRRLKKRRSSRKTTTRK